jgi:hypothetical protein
MCICGVTQLESNFEQLEILSREDIEYLKQMYERYPKQFWTRDFNLFNLYKCDIPRQMNAQDLDFMRMVSNKIKHHVEFKNDAAHYFLKYVPNSFTVVHVDNPQRIKRTAVTLIDASPDLVGGDVVLLRDIAKSELVSGPLRPESPVPNVKVPIVVKSKLGSTLIYNYNVKHGVSKVEQGYRLVLISWFN